MDAIIIDTISAVNYRFIREWFKYSPIKPDYADKIETIKKLFTEGGCAIYGEFLYDIFKDYGVVLGKTFDHIIIGYNGTYYDAMSGFEPNSSILKKEVEEYGFTPYNLETEKGREELEYYKDVCCKLYDKTNKYLYGNYNECISILNSFKDDVKMSVKKAVERNKIKSLKLNNNN